MRVRSGYIYIYIYVCVMSEFQLNLETTHSFDFKDSKMLINIHNK